FSNHNPKYDPTPLTDTPATVGTSVRWSVPIGSGSGYGFAPMVLPGNVYAATPDGNVVNVNAATGGVAWKTNVGSPLSAGVGSNGAITAVVATDASVIALDAQGNELWRSKASSAVNVPPTVGDGLVVVRTTDYRIQAFDAA